MLEVKDSEDERFSKYYNIKASPEFIFCFYGIGYLKQTGVNFETLKEKMEKINDFYLKNSDHFRKFEDYLSFDEEFRIMHDNEREIDNIGKDF